MIFRRFLMPDMRNALRMLESDLQGIKSGTGRIPFETFFQDISRGPRSIAANVIETKQVFRIEAEIPGAKKEDVNIELTDDHSVAIHGNIKSAEKTEGNKIWSEERSVGEFHRIFQLPSKLSQEGIKADMKDGVLTLEIPKSTENGSKKISIDWKTSE